MNITDKVRFYRMKILIEQVFLFGGFEAWKLHKNLAVTNYEYEG